MKISRITRRTALKQLAGTAALGALGLPPAAEAQKPGPYRARKGRIQQSVIHWCFKPMAIHELAAHAVELGMKSVELVVPESWPNLKKLGLICAMVPSHGFARGFAHKDEHEECLKILLQNIDLAADAGFPNVITFSGFRRGISDAEGMKNMVEGLKPAVEHAEKKKVTLCLEMLNSRVNIQMKGHPDYFCDNIDKTFEVCKRIGSPRMKVLFDIYHVQIMHGDVITRIKESHPLIGHYHTAGVPGRNELDDHQEINYPAVMSTIAETGFTGYVGQEFIPTRDPVNSLSEAVQICDV
jgi:hydroxypyruvate isomerase